MFDFSIFKIQIICFQFRKLLGLEIHETEHDCGPVIQDFELIAIIALTLLILTTNHSADYFDDLYSFDPGSMTWTLLLSADGTRPAARYSHGFTSAGGKLYVHGGYGRRGSVQVGMRGD
jgi:hypothetical protein